jgi:hypothetical protein
LEFAAGKAELVYEGVGHGRGEEEKG